MHTDYFDIINPEKLEETKRKVKGRITKGLRCASVLRAIADNLDGAYITKRLEGKLAAIIPGASRVYLSHDKWSDYIDIHVEYPDCVRYDDQISLRICKTDTRRIEGDSLRGNAEMIEEEAAGKQRSLDNLDAAVEIYNNLADCYAKISHVLEDCLYGEVPYADYNLKKKYKDDLFTDPAAVPPKNLQVVPQHTAPKDPVPLPVRPVETYTLEEFTALVSGSAN